MQEEMNQVFFRDLVSSFYQFQQLRIQTGNRLVAHFYTKLGVVEGEKLQDQEGEKIEMIDHLKANFKRIADAFAAKDDKVKVRNSADAMHDITRRQFEKLPAELKSVFTDFSELSMMQQYRSLLNSESKILKEIEAKLEEFPIWTQFLKGIKGVGPTMAGVIVGYLDPHSAEYPSSFWKYAGLDVGPDGRGRGKFAEHLVDVEYTDKTDGSTKKRKGITFNPFVKTKLVGVLADVMVKCNTPIYRKAYDDYKHRIANHPNHKEKSAAHRHRMALRYLMKRFLVDLHMKWRELEGLPVTEEYSVRKLGMVHRDPEATKERQDFIMQQAGLEIPETF